MGNRNSRGRVDAMVGQDVGSAASDGSVSMGRDGAILRITLDRPASRNSLSHTMIDDSRRRSDATPPPTIPCVPSTSREPATTSARAPTGWPPTAVVNGPRTGDLVRRIPHTAHRVIELVHTIHLPVVCTVRGWAVGLGLQPGPGRRLHRRRRPTRRSGSPSWPAASARIRVRRGCCPGWSGWRGPSRCCCSARRSAAPTPPTGD